MTARSKTSPSLPHFFFDVIPDGAPLLCLLTSSRTARSAEPGSRRALRQCLRHPRGQRATQAVTAKPLDPGFRLRRPRDDIKKQNAFPSQRVHPAGAPLLSDVIPDDALPSFDVIPDSVP